MATVLAGCGSDVDVELVWGGPPDGSQTVVVTLDGIPDDSVRAERWTLGFAEEGVAYAPTAALREVRCRPGRGHADLSAGLCS